MKKYGLIESVIEELYRIRALKDFNDVKEGDIGGYIQKESNLSHEGDCWIYDNARVFGDAEIYGNAEVYEYAITYGKAEIYGEMEIYKNAAIFGEEV